MAQVSSATSTASAQVPSAAISQKTDEMGQQAFLKLFTTQLQNQDPLEPVKNEAFVAQLAQFSQLEATTKMADSIGRMSDAMKSERIMSGASLIGKRVASPTGAAQLTDGATIRGTVSMPNGANDIRVDVFDKNGSRIFGQSLGRQAPGDVTVSWSGNNDKGERMPAGLYTIVATVDSFGEISRVPITTPAQVKSVSFNSTTSELMLELVDGSTVPLSQVNRVDG